MKNKESNRKNSPKNTLVGLLWVAAGIFCGHFAGDIIGDLDVPLWIRLPLVLFVVALFYLAVLIQVFLHEAGHLIFGLLTGYRFTSFRIFSLLLLRQDGKLRLKRLSLAGTGGQCLMAPPEMQGDTFPVFWFNFGGVFMNLWSGALLLALSFLNPASMLSAFFRMVAIVGFVFALINGIPMCNFIPNDGANAVSVMKNKEARRAFWIGLKMNSETAAGKSLDELPAEWFAMPSDDAMQDANVAVLGVLAAEKELWNRHFEEAERQIAHLLEIPSGMSGFHRNYLMCYRLYLELIGEKREDVIESLKTKEFAVYRKSMKNSLNVLLAEYAYALLYQPDAAKAEAVRAAFEKCTASYPYPSEAEAERGLMDLAKEKAAALSASTENAQ